jgi:polyisoprenyl-phosphate glycosyltransferase
VLGGVQLFMIGIMGEYIGKMFSELKARPIYFVAEQSLKTAEESVENVGRAGDQSTRTAAE